MIITDTSVDDLKIKLMITGQIDESGLADQLIAMHFTCTGCTECCRSSSGDNRVIVFPDEINRIIKTYKKKWNEVCGPSSLRFIDKKGMMHAIEWELRRNNNGDCTYLREDGTCSIYDQRPWICRTYPFYLTLDAAACHLEVSDCRGFRGSMTRNEALELAILLTTRLAEEIREEIQVLKNLEDYSEWNPVRDHSQSDKKNNVTIAVHDSSGTKTLIFDFQ